MSDRRSQARGARGLAAHRRARPAGCRRGSAAGIAPGSAFRRNRLAMAGLVIVLLLVLVALFAPADRRSQAATSQVLQRPPAAADSAVHWFGTDELGRDIFRRVVFGSRITLTIVVLVAVIVVPVGLGDRPARRLFRRLWSTPC